MPKKRHKKSFDIFFESLKDLKAMSGFEIIDTHVHPLDVMGVMHPSDFSNSAGVSGVDNRKSNKKSVAEILKFGSFYYWLLKKFFRLSPKFIEKEIRAMFDNVHEKRILADMERSLIDRIVFAPVEPFLSLSDIREVYNNKRFDCLGSVDINGDSLEEIDRKMKECVEDYKIAGFKLHPNLQNFKPVPGDNDPQVEEKLNHVYNFAEDNNLYILFHGGKTEITKSINEKYGGLKRSRNNARLENFFGQNGESDIFDRNLKIVLAHLGHHFENKLKTDLVRRIRDKYENVYFDTSGASPANIKAFIEMVGSKRLIFGSDAYYNSMSHSIYFIYEAVCDADSNEDEDEMIKNILGANYKRLLAGN